MLTIPPCFQDREVKDSYSFGVVATNYLSEIQLFGTATVNIRIRDINDEVPVLGQENYSEDIDEITPVGTTILTVTASDGDMSGVSSRDHLNYTTVINFHCRHQIRT